jgi:hypothetical protein
MPRFSLKRAIAPWVIVSAALMALILSQSPYLGETRPLDIVEIQPGAGPNLPNLYLHHRISTLRHRLSFINED